MKYATLPATLLLSIATTAFGVVGVLLTGTEALADRAVFPTRNLAQVAPAKFDVHVNDLSDEGVPVVQPWKAIKLDLELRGGWVVVGDLTGDGTAVWIYKNENGLKTLSRERLTMPVNATLY